LEITKWAIRTYLIANQFLWWFFVPSKIIKPLLVMVLRSPSQEPSIWVLRIEIEIGHGTKTKQHWFGFWRI
jgi:hypothetical protein